MKAFIVVVGLLATLNMTVAQDTCDDQTDFACDDGLSCVPRRYICDFYTDCDDNSDETNCTCDPDTMFQCKGGGCVDIGWKCDDMIDCFDGSDEATLLCDINECNSDPCQNDATCEDGDGVYTCICVSGWIGDNCEQEINECLSRPCQNRGRCVNEVNQYICNCRNGWNGINCETDVDECASDPCRNDGTCEDRINGFVCQCVDGYSGRNCEQNVDECASDPCRNNGTCGDRINGFVCQCLDGYSGRNCEQNVDECASEPCQNEGACEDRVNGFVCQCVDGYVGVNCEQVVCTDNEFSCADALTCIPEIYHCDFIPDCYDNSDESVCVCNIAYEFPCISGGCIHSTWVCDGFEDCFDGSDETGGAFCQGFDECSSNPCQNDGTCYDGLSQYLCICKPGWTGTNCEINMYECYSRPCLNNGRCQEQVNGYICQCGAGWIGTNCERNIDECASDPCQNGGTCEDGDNGYTCDCADGFIGFHCQQSLWNSWGAWSVCSQTCGTGTRSRRRSCSVPGGCTGDSTDSSDCNTQTCLNSTMNCLYMNDVEEDAPPAKRQRLQKTESFFDLDVLINPVKDKEKKMTYTNFKPFPSHIRRSDTRPMVGTAINSSTNTKVVLKKHSILNSPLASPIIEVICLKRLKGVDSAIQLLDYYVDKEEMELVLVLEYPARCFTLHECMTLHRQMPQDMTGRKVISSVANALMLFSDEGVVYGGLDPENVLFCISGGRWIVKLLDFEACTEFNDGRFTQVEKLYPEPYRSPEQDVDADDFDREAAQVYALGCIAEDMIRAGFVRNCSVFRVLAAQMKATNPELRPSMERIAFHRFLNGQF